MLKRSVWLILVLCLFLTACGAGTPTATPTGTATPTETATPNITPAPTSAITSTPEVYVTFRPDLDTTSKASYKITTVRDTRPIVSQQDEVLIEYPQVTNFGDAKKEAQLNKMLKDHFFDSIKLKKEDYAKTCPDDLSLGNYDVNITYTVTMQTKELLSIVYNAEVRSFPPGGLDAGRGVDDSNGFAIVIDLNAMKRLKLSDFTSTFIENPYPEELYGDIKGIDLYYRIKNSNTAYRSNFKPLITPDEKENEKLWEGFYNNKYEFKEMVESTISSGLPFLFEGVDVPEYRFFLMEDGVYYMTRSTNYLGGEYGVYVKILAETEWELPQG